MRNIIHPILVNNLMRESNRGVNLSLTLGQSIQVQSTSFFIMTEESLIIKQIRLRGNMLIINSLPIIGRHLSLNDIQVLTKQRKGLTILSFRQAKNLGSLKAIGTSLRNLGICRVHPLCEQRNRLILVHVDNIRSPLILNYLRKIRTQGLIINQSVDNIPTRILGKQRQKILEDRSTTILSNILEDNTRSASLTLTLSYIHDISKPTDCQTRILSISLSPHIDNLLIAPITHRRELIVHIEQSLPGSSIKQSTILSALILRHRNLSIPTLTSILHLIDEVLLSVSTSISLLVGRILRTRCPRLIRHSLILGRIICLRSSLGSSRSLLRLIRTIETHISFLLLLVHYELKFFLVEVKLSIT